MKCFNHIILYHSPRLWEHSTSWNLIISPDLSIKGYDHIRWSYNDLKEIGGVDKLGVSSADTKPPDLTKVLIHSQDFVSVDPLPSLFIRWSTPKSFYPEQIQPKSKPINPLTYQCTISMSNLLIIKSQAGHILNHIYILHPTLLFCGEKLVLEWIW